MVQWSKALAAGILVGLLVRCAGLPGQVETREDGAVPVKFSLKAPGARKVCVAGSFNHWSSSRHCLRQGEKAWSLTVAVPPGRHAYVFVVDDGAWRPDPESLLSEDSGFGFSHSVVVVE